MVTFNIMLCLNNYYHSQASSKPSLEGFIISLRHRRRRRRRHHRVITTKGSQARPGASKPARDFTFGIQERRQALGS